MQPSTASQISAQVSIDLIFPMPVTFSMDDYMTFNPASYGSELRQRKEKFMVDVNAYNANRKAVGAIAPNHFKKAITATVVEP